MNGCNMHILHKVMAWISILVKKKGKKKSGNCYFAIRNEIPITAR